MGASYYLTSSRYGVCSCCNTIFQLYTGREELLRKWTYYPGAIHLRENCGESKSKMKETALACCVLLD